MLKGLDMKSGKRTATSPTASRSLKRKSLNLRELQSEMVHTLF